MVIKATYRKDAPYILTFDWIDFAQGTGIKTFYLADSETSAAVDFNLTENSSISSRKKYSEDNGDTDIDFDLSPFTKAVTIKGTAMACIFWRINSGKKLQLTLTVYHYDGSTETSLGTVTTDSHTAAANENGNFLVPITLTEKKFSPGDILRLNVVVADYTSTVYWFHDPANSSPVGAGETSNSFITIPFKIT